ncbi:MULTISPECIES: TetR/AcrR family transcriptional regulator [Burkholderia]|uniref:TetR/AcrR family transcriptional regulator n=2 Tax=Burkholderia cepacia complex TaxID=87882 RepID=A0A2Z5N8R7_BURPY|nr:MULTISPECIES: TetR/AcrR family transcriptional regulator [Burkholderia]AXF25530.1 TetR/AcrR family transcriptional regulator [Burkholderia pyrrocinia]KVK75907.1 TetR family transcriptional regulator [Burkholderia cepacia]MBE2966674.1 TetR family transcriptional regulator [Burkholderia cepacia]
MGATASPWKKAEARESERERKRLAVLRTAARLFNEKGFHASSLDEVAERLHITKPTVYYYAKNKDEILFECVRMGLDMMQQAIRDITVTGGSAVEKFEAAMLEYAKIVTMDFGMCVIRIGEESLIPENRVKLRRLKADIDHEFRILLEKAIEEKAFAPIEPKLGAFVVAGALSWIGRWYREDGQMTAEEIARQATSILLNGLRAR